MGKIAAVFPGQGSQYVGMGQALAESEPVVRETFAEADRLLGFSLSELCFHGPEEKLTETANTQPALLTVSVGVYRLLRERGFRPDAVAGHSLGEYSALVAAGAMTFADAVQIVRLRGQLMEGAVPRGIGTMAAILGMGREDVEALCQEVDGCVEPATYNAPGQVVVAGETKAVKAAMELARERGARRCQLLNVSGPFHSSMLKEAGEKLGEALADVDVKEPDIPVYANVTAQPAAVPDEIRAALTRQVSAAVRWEETIAAMADAGVETFVEVGPNRVLCGLIRRIRPEAKLFHVESIESLEKFLAR